MKSIFFAVISFVIIGNYSIAQRKAKNVVVNGTVVNGKISFLIFNRYTIDNTFSDTIFVKNNKFLYSQYIDEPQWTNVTIPQIGTQGLEDFSFFMEKGKIEIKLDAHSIGKSIVSGTTNNVLRTQYLKDNKEILDSISQYTSLYLAIEDRTAAEDAPQDSLIYLNKRLDILDSMRIQIDSSFIVNHSASYFSLTLLKDAIKNGMPIEKALPVFAKINNSLHTTSLWSDLNKTIKHLNQYQLGKRVADLNALDSTDRPFGLKSFYEKNTYTLIDLWASWCIPCQQEFPFLRNAYNMYRNNGFDIYSLSIDFTKDAWINALNRLKLPWLNVHQGQDLPEFYMVSSIPFNVLVNAKGEIIARDLRGDKLLSTLKDLYKK